MLCSCGQPGDVVVPRRAMPYCESCFVHMLAAALRHEVGPGPVRARLTHDWFSAALRQLCLVARRELLADSQGFTPGCQETQAAAVVEYLFAPQPTEIDGVQLQARVIQHIPSSITRQELQRFMRAEPPKPSHIELELATLEKQYPGTCASIAKFARSARSVDAAHGEPPRNIFSTKSFFPHK
jgi:hypothetical protein